jgi:hypothetical protein
MYINSESVTLNTDNTKSIIVANMFAYVANKLDAWLLVFVVTFAVWFVSSVVAAFAIFDAFDFAIL